MARSSARIDATVGMPRAHAFRTVPGALAARAFLLDGARNARKLRVCIRARNTRASVGKRAIRASDSIIPAAR